MGERQVHQSRRSPYRRTFVTDECYAGEIPVLLELWWPTNEHMLMQLGSFWCLRSHATDNCARARLNGTQGQIQER